FKLPVIARTGSHKIMVFSEMHYQRSHRPQDVPRVFPPTASVPHLAMGGPDGVTEQDMIRQELLYTTLDEYSGLTVPDRVARSYDPARASELFRVNCAVCHGGTMRGDGAVATMMKEKKMGPLPADLMLELTQAATEGQLFGFISRGGRQGLAAVSRGRETGSPMPPFQYLLTEDERWELTKYVLAP
ncbi:MAG: cytochrome c, partial [Candidatus Brocadiia bacterium]|nr:cytochrome c [Candidatus Brocadiia bacterium]